LYFFQLLNIDTFSPEASWAEMFLRLAFQPHISLSAAISACRAIFGCRRWFCRQRFLPLFSTLYYHFRLAAFSATLFTPDSH
jgi:hypothetical protein